MGRGGDVMTTNSPTHLRDQALAAVTNAADPRVIATIDALIAEANASGRTWSTNEIRHRMPECDRHLVGARVRAAATRRPVEMVRVGYVQSSLPSTHAHPVAQWLGVAHVDQVAS